MAWALADVPWQKIADGTLQPVVVLETADGQPLMDPRSPRAAYASRDDFPQHLVDAVIAAEDRRFYEHEGLDFRAITRAAFRNMAAGGVEQGGSTITQQLVKILYLDSGRTLKRKIQEAVVALWLDRRLPKDEILTRYLNSVYLGAGATGMPAAARVYFGKDLRDVDVVESAMLAALIRAPSQLNPLTNLDAARARTDLVLDALGESGKLDEAAAKDAKARLATLEPVGRIAQPGNWFLDWVTPQANDLAAPYSGTIRVRTTLMPRLQEIAEHVVKQALDREGKRSNASQAALIAMRPDGSVVALVGGRDYQASQFNRAVNAQRQPGSAFKLFPYYAAIKAGISPWDWVNDEPIEINGWSPENYSGRYFGRVRVAEAFARSLNAATVGLATEIGIDKTVAAARELGIDAKLVETPSLALGTSEVTLLDLTGAYASVRAGAAPVQPWGIASFHADGQPQAFRVGPPEAPRTDIRAYQPDLVSLLELVVERGTGREAQLDEFAAGKTGTSQNFRDAWFVGFNDCLVVGVWVGNDDETPMKEVTGGKLPAHIWREFLLEARSVLDATDVAPENTLEVLPQQEEELLPSHEESDPNVSDEVVSSTATDMEGFPGLDGQQSVPACNYEVCSRFYRSFRPSDCTYQPYRGPRRICER
nr:PBP1A family penicillin-binding protein [Pseudaminobacter soli]